MSANVRIQWRRGYLRQILRSQDVGDDIERRASRVLSEARSTAPLDTGDFQQSLDMTVGIDGDRVKGRVYTTDPGGMAIEGRHRTLRDALGAGRG